MFSLRFICAGKDYSTFNKTVPAPYLRRSFSLDTVPDSARLTICGLGFYDLYLNGARLTKGLLAPYISNPDDILYYDEYDVSDMLRAGENVIGIVLGNGMLNSVGGAVWDFDTARYRGAPRVALALETGSAGSTQLLFEADERFKCAPSPIYFDDLRAGEWYDARNERPGWMAPGFDDADWTPALPAETPRGECRICMAEPIAPLREIRPVNVRKAGIGALPGGHGKFAPLDPTGDEAATQGWLYDFGINTAGLCRLRISGRRGQKIILQFAEILDTAGDIDLRGMQFLPNAFNHRDIYICKGDGVEVYMPSFTYHGFRYCLALGLDDQQATPELLTLVEMSSALPDAGDFHSSSAVLNQLQVAARRSDLSNFFYFPTDCPHREKNGWTGDAALSCRQMLMNFAAENSMREWLNNIRAAQRIDGAIPGVIPTSGWGFAWGNGPAWDAALIELPYQIWRLRGDIGVARENATAIMKYLNYLSLRRDERGLVHIGLGDWCHAAHQNRPKAPLVVTDTLTSMDICNKAAQMFDGLDMPLQSGFAHSLYAQLRLAARKYLVDYGSMTVLGGCQTSQAMALHYGLFEPGEQKAAFDVLLEQIEQADGLMDVGVLGARVLFRVLSEHGRTDLAYDMVATERFPSYGYWIAQGATSLWEGFWSDAETPMSLNHHFWGDISAWMIECLAGINPNPAGASPDEVRIMPRIIAALDSAEACYNAPAGQICVKWSHEGADVMLDVKLPENAYGTIQLERCWQFEDGTRVKPAKTGQYRLLPGKVRDRIFTPMA